MPVVLPLPAGAPDDALAAATPARGGPRRRRRARAARFLAAFLLPLGLAPAAVRYLVPAPIDGGIGGPLAWLARLGDEQPALLTVALFLALRAAAGHWLGGGRARGRAGAAAPAADAPPEALVRRRDRWLGLGLWAVAIGAAAILARATLLDVQRVAGGSMAPTLNGGDRLLVNRLAYGLRLPFSARRLGARAPRRGDVVVFPNLAPDRERRAPAALVKRVIGLPGDVITFRDGSPAINGWAAPSCDAGPFLTVAGGGLVRGRLAVEALDGRAYLTVRRPTDDGSGARFQVPAGEVYVLGDDRVASDDSRAWNGGRGGGVPIAAVEGRVSRLALGASRAGRLELRQLLAPLRPTLRETEIDVGALERGVERCLTHLPRDTRPPAPTTAPNGGTK